MTCSNCGHGTIEMENGTILHHGVLLLNESHTHDYSSMTHEGRYYSGKLCMEGDCQCLKPNK